MATPRGRGRRRSLDPKPNVVNGSSLQRPGSSAYLAPTSGRGRSLNPTEPNVVNGSSLQRPGSSAYLAPTSGRGRSLNPTEPNVVNGSSPRLQRPGSSAYLAPTSGRGRSLNPTEPNVVNGSSPRLQRPGSSAYLAPTSGRGRSLNPTEPNVVNGSSPRLQRPGLSAQLAPTPSVAVEGQFADMQPMPMDRSVQAPTRGRRLPTPPSTSPRGPGLAKLCRVQQQGTHDVAAEEPPVESQFADVQQTAQTSIRTAEKMNERYPPVIHLSRLPPEVTSSDIRTYLEAKGSNVQILSCVKLGKENAKAAVSGYTAEELKWLQSKPHKMRQQNIGITVADQAQPLQDEEADNPDCTEVLNVLEVRNIPSKADDEILRLYFESPKSGGCDDGVEECSISHGTAYIKFHSPEVAARVLSKKDHAICGTALHLKYAKPEEAPKDDLNKLVITKIPDGIDQEYLQMFLETTLRMDHEVDFSLEVPGEHAVVTFTNDYTHQELLELVEKIQSKSMKKSQSIYIRAELCKVTKSIRISNIENRYDEDFLTMYFSSPSRSGGGDCVETVQLLGNGEAIITFTNPQVLKEVLSRSHTTFGKETHVERVDPYREMSTISAVTAAYAATVDPTTPHKSPARVPAALQPIEIKVNPLQAKCVLKNTQGIEKLATDLNVTLASINDIEGKIIINPTERTAAGWSQQCQQQIVSYLKHNFPTIEIPIPKEALTAVHTSLQNMARLAFAFNLEGTVLCVAGDHTTITALPDHVKRICDNYERIQVTISLQPEQFEYICKSAARVKKEQPTINVKFNSSDCSLLVQGLRQNVSHFERLLPEYTSHESVHVEIPVSVVQYFSTESGGQELKVFIQSHPEVVAYFKQNPNQNPNQLYFLCDPIDIESAKEAATELQRATIEQVYKLPTSFTSLPPADLEEYSQRCKYLECQWKVKIITDTDTEQKIIVVGFKTKVDQCSQDLLEFLSEKCNTHKSMEIKRGIWRLFKTIMHDRWRCISSHCEQKGVKLVEPENADLNAAVPVVVQLHGDRQLVEEIYQEILTEMKNVIEKKIPVQRPGVSKYFQGEEAKIIIAGIETHNNVCIEIAEPNKAESKPKVREILPTHTKVCTAQTKEMKTVGIYVGDITEFDHCDVLVNAANGKLQHIGGVAKAIADKGGQIIQEASTQYVQMRGSLDDGDAWLTKDVGKLPCKALVHAVGPRWSGGQNNEDAFLQKACSESLEAASRYNYHSIAFPAISSGVYGFPMNRCAQALIRAVVEFSRSQSFQGVSDINFVLKDHGDAQPFITAMRKYLSPDNIFMEPSLPIHSSPPQAVSRVPAAVAVPKMSKKPKKHAAADVSSSVVKLHQGNLASTTADVHVNSSNTNLDLSMGALAPALLKVAGPSLQAECNEKAPVSDGDIAITGAGNLPSRYVFHAVVPRHDGSGGQAEKALKSVIQKSMKECAKLGLSSIAFPAIGTGNLGFPPNTMAKVMIGEVMKFLSSHKDKPITVHLVVYLEDIKIHKAFEEELKRHSQFKSDLFPDLPRESDQDSNVAKRAAYRPRGTSTFPGLSGDQTLNLNNLKIHIIKGDITNDSSDCVVNTTNPELKLVGTGVAGALLKKGGPELQRHCETLSRQGTRLTDGKVFVTPAAGELRCKSIFHVTFSDSNKLVKTITACLQRAEELQYQSIAFPAIGTGTYGNPAENITKLMMKGIHQFASSNPTHVKCVHIVLFKSDVYDSFVKVLQNPLHLESDSWWDRTKEWFGFSPSNEGSTTSLPPSTAYRAKLVSNEYEEMVCKELELKIYGKDQGSVQQAEKLIWSTIEDRFVTEKVKEEKISDLSPSQEARLKEMSREMHVDMQINRAPLNYIRLKGDKIEVQQMKNKISEFFRRLEYHESQQHMAQTTQKLVAWKRLDSKGTELEYDPELNFKIEQAHQKKYSQYDHNDGTENFTIDFSKMIEIDHATVPDKTYKIKRVDLKQQYHTGTRPKNWDPMPKDASGKEVRVTLVDLDPKTEEYKKIQREFDDSMKKGYPASYSRVEKIQRVQNPTLYAQYQASKREMDKQNPQGHKNERLLWHGTQATTCEKINPQGFNRSFAGHNAIALGRGVYFACNASYSASNTYSPKDQNGHKRMYYVRVLTGEYTVGNSSMLVPPAKNNPAKDPYILFDSVVNDQSNPGMFVVFGDNTAYPDYLVVFS